jgi:hypothetical protein
MTTRSGNFRIIPGVPIGDDWEQLQDVLQWTHNRRVMQEFRDITPNDEEWEVNLNTPRSRLRWAVTIRENDSALICSLRLFLFYVIMGQAAAMQTPIYGIPVPGYQESRVFQPQIELYFLEDYNDVDTGYSPVSGSIRFRVQNWQNETITEPIVNQLALKVRSSFATGSGFVWRKGRTMATYTDRKKGYKMQLLVRNESEARRIVEQVLDIQTDSPDWENLNISANQAEAARYPIIPPNERILNRTRRGIRKRPIADVRFIAAFLHLHGLPNPIVLVDRSGRHRNPIVTV